MNKKISLGLSISIMALVAAVTFSMTYWFSMDIFNSKLTGIGEKEAIFSRLTEVDTFVRNNYIYNINEDVLMDNIIKGYIAGLGDPYAGYYSPLEYAQLQQRDAGVFIGLGFEFERAENGYIKITSVMEGTSAWEEGLIPGDIIMAINNLDVIAYENGYDEAVTFLRCDEGVRVKLYVQKINDEGITDFITVDLISGVQDIITVHGEMIGDTGYIQISSFNEKTPVQLQTMMDELLDKGAGSLIFDLRDNPGGIIEALEGTLDLIVGAGDIVTAHYKSTPEVVVKTTNPDRLKIPMVVIVNGNTSSSAELFAFALRDICAAQVVGVTSYGKGVMQSLRKLSNGGAVKVTVATLQTEKSGDYNGIGIKPQFDVPLPTDVNLNNISKDERLLFDTQLIKALEIAETIR